MLSDSYYYESGPSIDTLILLVTYDFMLLVLASRHMRLAADNRLLWFCMIHKKSRTLVCTCELYSHVHKPVTSTSHTNPPHNVSN